MCACLTQRERFTFGDETEKVSNLGGCLCICGWLIWVVFVCVGMKRAGKEGRVRSDELVREYSGMKYPNLCECTKLCAYAHVYNVVCWGD